MWLVTSSRLRQKMYSAWNKINVSKILIFSIPLTRHTMASTHIAIDSKRCALISFNSDHLPNLVQLGSSFKMNFSESNLTSKRRTDWDSFNREVEEYFTLFCSTGEPNSANSPTPPQNTTSPKSGRREAIFQGTRKKFGQKDKIYPWIRHFLNFTMVCLVFLHLLSKKSCGQKFTQKCFF